MPTLDAVFSWLLRASWQASVLVGLVLLTQWIFRKSLSPAWRYALWLLVLARLLMPVSPQSPVSLFNLTRLTSFESPPASVSASSAHAPTVAPAPTSSAATPPAAVSPGAPRAAAAASSSAAIPRRPPTDTAGSAASAVAMVLRTALPFVWLTGVCWLLLRMVWQNARFARRVLRRRQVTDTAALEALEDCRQSMGLRTPLTVIETSEVKSPALYGFIRPRLVLPQGTLAAFSREELYYIFLHELAHVKRSDMAVNWLISGLRALHWFNPILWFGFQRMAADREVAADALALAHAPGGGRQVVYSMGEETANDRAKPIPSIIWSIAVTGGQPVEIKFNEADVGDLAVHPDGRQIAFRAGPGGETKIWVLEGLSAKPAASAAGN